MPRRGQTVCRAGLAAVLSAWLAGCASLPPDATPNPAEGPKFQPAELAVVPARFQPLARLEAVGRTKGEAAAEGVLMGGAVGGIAAVQMGAGISAGVSGGLSLPAGPLVAALLPVFVAVGAVAGAISEERRAAPQALIDEGRAAMDRLIAGQALQHRLQAAVQTALREERLATPPVPNALGPDAPNAAISYAGTGLPPVLEVAVTDFGFQQDHITTGKNRLGYGLRVTLNGRLLAADGTTVLDSLSHTLHSDAYAASRWLENDAALFNQEVDRVLQHSAQILVLEFFRLYYPPAANAPADGRRGPVPYFALDALYPQPREGLDPRGIFIGKYAGGFGFARFGAVEELQPVFRWESFPRVVDAAGPERRFTDVSYEFRLYETELSWTYGIEAYRPGALVYARDDLPQPSHRLEVPLQPCTRYAWTVRARFRFNEAQERVTEWTGGYTMMGASTHLPWKWRRGLNQRSLGTLGMVDSKHLFLLLRAPPAAGQSSCPA